MGCVEIGCLIYHDASFTDAEISLWMQAKLGAFHLIAEGFIIDFSIICIKGKPVSDVFLEEIIEPS